MRSRGPLVYDISRLMTRIVNRTPNGIDRVDFALAEHFISPDREDRSGLMMTTVGPRVLSRRASREAIEMIHAHWGERHEPDADETFTALMAALRGPPAPTPRCDRPRTGRSRALWGWLKSHGPKIGVRPRTFLGPRGVYINVSQFPLEAERYFRWIDPRGDVDFVFFIHDLLPLQMPEYFKPHERAVHQRRLQTLAHIGRAVVVSTQVVKTALQERLSDLGRGDMPILVAPLPVDATFSDPLPDAAATGGHPYFVMCGTIEPRKNHLLVLHVWRRLVEEFGDAAPKLVLVGARGWENEHIVDLLERCPHVESHVIEVSGLETPALRRLIAGARAALAPSFAEGYGLPLVEALAAGAPVIASDIPAFAEIGGDFILRLDPTDGPAWRRAILAFAEEPSPLRCERLEAMKRYRAPAWDSFFASVEDFIADLSPA